MPILWVLVRYPDGRREPEALLCTDTTASPRDVLDCFSRRWTIETTYEEARAHLGMETQRQWSDPAVFRTTPLLLGLYSAVTLYVHQNAECFAPAWCTNQAPGCSRPNPGRAQAARTCFGRPCSSMRLSAWVATFTSVARHSFLCERSSSPTTCFQRPIAASARARRV